MSLGLINLETGEILEHNVLIVGRKPKYLDRGFIKVFVAFLEDVVSDKEISGKAVRLLLYMLEKLNLNDLTVYINPKDVCKDLGIGKQTYYNWLNLLLKKGYVEKLNPYVFRLKAYTAIKGNMGKTIEDSLNRKLAKPKRDAYLA